MSKRIFNRVLTAILLVLLIASIFATAYVAVNPPRTTDPYTEFYLLGSEGNASDYPTDLEAGERGSITVGVSNHEGESTDYRIQIVDTNASGDGVLASQSKTVADGESWETNVTFSINESGYHRVQFQLYKNDISGEPYLTTRLWINVTSAESTNQKVKYPPRSATKMERP